MRPKLAALDDIRARSVARHEDVRFQTGARGISGQRATGISGRGAASLVAPRCFAIETATAIPRALKLWVGFCDSSLTQRFGNPSSVP